MSEATEQVKLQIFAFAARVASYLKSLETAKTWMETDPTYVIEWHGKALACGSMAMRLKASLDAAEEIGSSPEVVRKQMVESLLSLVFRETMNTTSVASNAVTVYKQQMAVDLLDILGVTPWTIQKAMFPEA